MNRCRYYCIMCSPAPGAIPAGAREVEDYGERRYIPEIDCMAWGWVEYDNPLTPQEIANYELIASPRKDEVIGYE